MVVIANVACKFERLGVGCNCMLRLAERVVCGPDGAQGNGLAPAILGIAQQRHGLLEIFESFILLV